MLTANNASLVSTVLFSSLFSMSPFAIGSSQVFFSLAHYVYQLSVTEERILRTILNQKSKFTHTLFSNIPKNTYPMKLNSIEAEALCDGSTVAILYV